MRKRFRELIRGKYTLLLPSYKIYKVKYLKVKKTSNNVKSKKKIINKIFLEEE
jgi:hypothetical protein